MPHHDVPFSEPVAADAAAHDAPLAEPQVRESRGPARREPERTCILTRKAGPAAELLRFVLAPGDGIVPDLRNRLPGRGAWLTPTAEAVREATRRKLFARAFKTEVRAPADLAEAVDALMVRDLVGALSLANKAGAVTSGFGKVESALNGGAAAALIHAREAAEDGRRKLAGTVRAALRRTDTAPILAIPVFDDLSGDDLDMAFGRDNVIHAALLAGAGSEGCVTRWRRLRRYRGIGDALPGDQAGPQREIDHTDETGPGGTAGLNTV